MPQKASKQLRQPNEEGGSAASRPAWATGGSGARRLEPPRRVEVATVTSAPAWAVLRLRGPAKVIYGQEETLRLLRLHRPNHLAVIPATDTYRGMVKKVEHLVTYGEIDGETLAKVIETRGRLEGGHPLTDEYLAAHSPFGRVTELAAAIVTGQATLKDVPGLKPIFRLSPPVGGLETSGKKRHVSEGGSLGYRGAAINELITRMV